MFKEYSDYDACGLRELIIKKEVSKSEILEAAIAKIESINPRINAVVYKMYDDARLDLLKVSEDSFFAGIPFLVKDLGLDTIGHPTSQGSRLTKSYTASSDAEIIRRYKRAGFITLGKTNVPEFGIMGVSEPYLWGPCRNPWNLSLTSGGSSGGSAAAVAARMVPIASADDGGGSIRIPASACGLFGFKPSRGLQPMGPRKNESWMSLVSGHVVTRTVRDSAQTLDLTKGLSVGAPYGPTKSVPALSESLAKTVKGMKVAFSKQSLFGEKTEDECLKAQEVTLKLCQDLGMIVEEVSPSFDKDELLFSYYVIVAASVAGDIARAEKSVQAKANLSNVEHATWFLKVAGEKLRANHLENAIYQARQATIIWENFFEKYDFFCTPTMAYQPGEIGLMNLKGVEKAASHLVNYLPLSVVLLVLRQIGKRGIEKTPNTSIFNMSGHPAMSVPTYWSQKNVPIGVQFVSRMGEDDRLFSLAAALESLTNWSARRPTL